MLVTYFSDFFPKWREAEPFEHRHLSHQEYVNYLTDYADHFGVTDCIRFNTEVTLVTRSGEGWRVTVVEHATGSSFTRSFDVVAICSGVHSEPHYPDFPGLETFQGQVLHAAHYRDPDSVTGRSALFIGAGENGGEIIEEASRHLDRSYLSLRRSVYVLPRFVNGVPNDYNGTRLLYSLPEFMARRTDEQALTMHRKLRRWLFPLWLLRKVMIRSRDALVPPCVREVVRCSIFL